MVNAAVGTKPIGVVKWDLTLLNSGADGRKFGLVEKYTQMLLRAIRDSRGTRDSLQGKGLRVFCVLRSGQVQISNAREFIWVGFWVLVADRWQIAAEPESTETYGCRCADRIERVSRRTGEISFWVRILSQKWCGFSFDYHGNFRRRHLTESLSGKGLRACR